MCPRALLDDLLPSGHDDTMHDEFRHLSHASLNRTAGSPRGARAGPERWDLDQSQKVASAGGKK